MGHKTTREHYNKYAAFYAVAPKAFDHMAMRICAGNSDVDPVKYLQDCYNWDKNLNNTFGGGRFGAPTRFGNYDVHYEETRRILKGHYGAGGFSLAENVCVIKHAMIYHILNLEPEFTGESIYDLHTTSIAPADGVSHD